MSDDDLAFMNLVLMVGTMAAQRMDALKTASPAERTAILPKAREAIRMLDALRKRTGGSLTPEEESVLGTLLKDLQTRYVKAIGFKPGASSAPPR